ncbi:nuclear polyadenylated RNA-binding protein-like protein Nab2 [Calycina marina]|uniref:Nuclear polyadenylated RNA-binding protein-like protein Nab2 n=1 Tax=Calycina marina TaxID=1763456 RepID=A0A9P7Z0E1_9HELO|nr:nuclear polyadenylated RNA-binding protein-like protein Nab2 [Calycina marina]
MANEPNTDSQLSAALSAAIQPKLSEFGWSTGIDDDAALAEYIILLWSNGKTESQLATELSGDLLQLGPDDPGVLAFSKWLFHTVDTLKGQIGGAAQSGTDTTAQRSGGNDDAEMNDISVGDSYVPTGPKSMRNGATNGNPRDKRFMNHLTKAMARTPDSALHRVRPQSGNERINTHRATPTGPRQQNFIKGAAGRTSGRPMAPLAQQNQAAQNMMNMTPQQQFQLYAMLEQQTQYYANLLNPQQQHQLQEQMANAGMAFGGNPMITQPPQAPGKSLFERVQPRQNGFKDRYQGNFNKGREQAGASSVTDTEMSESKPEIDPATTCRFNLTCTNKECNYAHQSPAAPPGANIDPTDECKFGAACKNRKCNGRHPSPALITAHKQEQDCMFYPNCTKGDSCPFRHPTIPPCRNGADCTIANCKFTHMKTVCKYNPCLNPICTFKHEEGQKRGKFEDKVWVAKEHVSERKFVDEGAAEELVLPGSAPDATMESTAASDEGLIA